MLTSGGGSRPTKEEEDDDDIVMLDNGHWINPLRDKASGIKVELISSKSILSSSSTQQPPPGYNKKRKRDVPANKPCQRNKEASSRPHSGKDFDINSKPSIITESEVSHLCLTANISSTDYEFLVPSKDQRANKPPEGYMTVYAEQVSGGLRFPLHDLVVKVCDLIKISPSQLVPNAHRVIVGFVLCAKFYKIPPTAYCFFSLFSVQCACVKRLFQFFPKFGKKFLDVPSSNGPWKTKFFFLRPIGKRWNCLTKWSKTFSKPSFDAAVSRLALKNGITERCFCVNKLTGKEILIHGGIEPGDPSHHLSFKYLMHKAAMTTFELLPEDLPPTHATNGVPKVSSDMPPSIPPSPITRSSCSPGSHSSSTPMKTRASANPSMPVTPGPPRNSATLKACTAAPAQMSTNLVRINPKQSPSGSVHKELPCTTKTPIVKVSSASSEDTLPLKKLYSKGKQDQVDESSEAHLKTNFVKAHTKTNCDVPVSDDMRPQSLPSHLLAISQALDSVYVPKACYQKLETEKKELTEEIEYLRSRVQELEQELELSDEKRAQSEIRCSSAMEATKSLEKRQKNHNSDLKQLRDKCQTLEESMSVQKECYQNLEVEKKELLEKIKCLNSRVAGLEQELEQSQAKRLDSENRTSRALEAVKNSEKRVEKLQSDRDKMREDIINEFKSSNEFSSAVADKAVTYYINGFETCRLQLVNLGKLPKGFNLEFLDASADEWGNSAEENAD